MTRTSRRIIRFVVILIIGIVSFIIYGGYLMDIEDRNGDLQQIYFDSNSGDVIINNMNGKIGVIEFKNRRMFVNTGTELLDIDEWLDPDNKFIFNTDVYRVSKDPSTFLNLNRKEFEEKVSSEELKPISHLELKY